MKRLLVVDDEEHTRLLCRRVVARSALVELHEASSGEEALALLATTPFDCVLSDYRMGEVDGIAVLAATLRDQPLAARVLMSGFAEPAVLEAARSRADIHGFIEKPMTAADFERALCRDVLEKHCMPHAVGLQ